MKGDGKIKIKIKFLNLGLNNEYQAYVKIFDGDEVICCGFTYNGEIELYLKMHKAYRLEAFFSLNKISTSFYTNTDKYIFIFNEKKYINTVTFSLRDYYYNLPIEKGEIILWQK